MSEWRTMPGIVADAAASYGERPAIRQGDVEISFTELDRIRRRSAAAFVAAGLKHGDRIAIWAPNIWEWVVALLGLQRTGAALVPLNTRYKGAEAADILRRSGARAPIPPI